MVVLVVFYNTIDFEDIKKTDMKISEFTGKKKIHSGIMHPQDSEQPINLQDEEVLRDISFLYEDDEMDYAILASDEIKTHFGSSDRYIRTEIDKLGPAFDGVNGGGME